MLCNLLYMIRIGVVLILRDCEAYLGYLFSQFVKLESSYKDYISFSYFIYENDSVDSTPQLLTQFSNDPEYKGRVHLLCEKHATEYVKDGTSCERIQRIVNARNRLLDDLRNKLAQTDWTLMIDSNIYFEPSCLQAMLDVSHKAAIVTCNTICVNNNNDIERSKILEVPRSMPYYTTEHYYDTYAFLDNKLRLLYPQCPSPLCKEPTCEKSPFKWSKDDSILRVKSAWGGFVLIDSAAFQHYDVRWEMITVAEAIQHGIIKTARYLGRIETNAVCEHIPFCKKVCEKLGKPCIVATTITPYWMR